MDENSIDRLRSATFPLVRKGYDPAKVEAFLTRLADWLEQGGGDEARAAVIKREIDRIGERTSGILASAEDTAQALRADAEREATSMVEGAAADAAKVRSDADSYSAKVRADADRYAQDQHAEANEYAETTRQAADGYANKTRDAADADAERIQLVATQRAEEIVETAEKKARRIVNDGNKRRREIEVVIADLVKHRNATIEDANKLAAELQAAAAAHTPDGEDPFARPRELDPLERGEELDEEPAEQWTS
ncbi:MAG TPA: DivIVA domain-containing protein [Solirubrobacterales bacterium]|nr:DivIVA domain-containing protein [Solirubrobacterales bacterium]